MSIKASSAAANERVSVDFLSLGKDNALEANGFHFDGNKIACMPAYMVKYTPYLNPGCNKMLYNSFNNRITFFMNDGKVILWDQENNRFTILGGVVSCPQHLIDCYFDDNHYPALICGNVLHILKPDGTVLSKTYSSEVYCCVYHHGRLFDVTLDDENKFYWTEQGMNSYDLGIGKGGIMCIPAGAGRIKRMFSLGDRIVILREYGINVMRGLADTRNFTLEPNTIMLGEKVIENTAVGTGKKIWFCTKHYLYCFDGGTLTQKEHSYGSDNDSVICLDIIDARYVYLSVTEGGVNYLVRYDPLTDEFVKFAKNCKYICRTPRGLFTYKGDVVGNLVKESGYGNLMKFKRIDFDNCKYKTLKRIVLNAEPQVKLKVAFKDAERSFDAGEYDNLNLTAQSFDFSLTGGGEVYGLKAVWEVFK